MASGDAGNTPVTLRVSPAQTVPVTHHQAPPPPAHHLPFTGFPLVAAVLLVVLLVALGSTLLFLGRRPSSCPRSA